MKPYYTIYLSQGCQSDQLYGHEVYKSSDLQAWVLEHRATVVNMPHEYNCASQEAKAPFVARRNECNCPRGDALREIEEIIGGRT